MCNGARTFSSLNLCIPTMPLAINTYVGIPQKRPKGRRDRTTRRGYLGSIFMPLLSRPPFWLLPFSAHNQLCAQRVVPAKWPFVGAIRHLCLQTSCKHLIVPACSHLWVQLSRNPGVPGIMHNLRGNKKRVFSKKRRLRLSVSPCLNQGGAADASTTLCVQPLRFRK